MAHGLTNEELLEPSEELLADTAAVQRRWPVRKMTAV